MRYPLAPLLKVRRLREDNALSALKNAESALALAREEEARRKKDLEDYAAWWREEEERRYAEILFTQMSLDQMDKFKQGLADLRAGEIQRSEALAFAEAEAQKAAQAVEEAKERLLLARKNSQKILAHQEVWQTEASLTAMRLEDAELEEFTAKSRLGAPDGGSPEEKDNEAYE
ncbi:type III secretion protein [Desulfovibrio sp. OttesenSCG-928-G11]|nr:type III secretion protein [Desulfovibrio sp. OttesenSCG-928-G11]